MSFSALLTFFRDSKTLKVFLSLIITAGFLYWLILTFSGDEIVAALALISPRSFVLGFTLYLISFLIRSLRFHILLRHADPDITVRRIYGITCLHTLSGNIVPFRMGELSFIYLMAREKISFSESGAALILVRLFDGLAMLAIFIILTFYVEIKKLMLIQSMAVTVLILVILGLVLVYRYGKTIIQKLKKRMGKKFIKFILHLERLFGIFERIWKINILVSLFLLSILLWLVLLAAISLVFLDIVDLPYGRLLFGLIFPSVVGILPVQGVAGAGTAEAGFIAGFLIVSLETARAMQLSLTYHAVALSYTVLAGVFGGILYKFMDLSQRTKHA